MIKYCPICNRSSDDVYFVGEICEICTIERVKKGFPAYAKLAYCNRCNRLQVTPEGYAMMNKNSMGTSLTRELCGKKCSIQVKNFDMKHANVEVSYYVGDDTVRFGQEIELKMLHDICQTCYRKSSGYYEAIVQLRGQHTRVQRMAARINANMQKSGAFIGRIETVVGGVDMYISDKRVLMDFFMRMRIKTKASYTLYGIKGGKKVYRNTYLLRLDE